jgi:hypothetical protein
MNGLGQRHHQLETLLGIVESPEFWHATFKEKRGLPRRVQGLLEELQF